MTTSRNGNDLIIIGGGVIGLSIAREVQALGLDPVVLDRRRAGRGASWAAAGMLSPLGEALEPGPFLELGLSSLARWPGYAAELEKETGIPIEFRECGKIRIATSQSEEDRLMNRLRWAHERGFPARWLSPTELAEFEPELRRDVRGGLLLEEDYRVDNRALGHALLASVRQRGIPVEEGSGVTRLVLKEDRCTAVELDDGTILPAQSVVLAAGAWSGAVEGLPDPVPVRPIRGEMAALHPRFSLEGRVLESEGIYLVPRDDGRVLLGATEDEVDFAPGPTAGGLTAILNAALALVPSLRNAPVSEIWCGYRPGSPDGMPILGRHPQVQGLYLATGHYRNGILLTPATGMGMATLLTGEENPFPREFNPDRFQFSSTHPRQT